MANWGNMVITQQGRNLEDKMHTRGSNVVFTKFKFGDGTLSAGRSYENLTDLVAPKLSLGVTRKEVPADGGSLIGTILTNANLTTGFKMYEAGLFAQDPDLGEILYLVITDNNPDYLPPKTSDTKVSVDFSVLIVVDDDLNVDVRMNMDSLLALRDLTNHNNLATAHGAAFNAHNTKADAHSNLFTTDNTTVSDATIASNTGGVQSLVTRVKWVKSYVENKIRTFTEFTASQIKDFNAKIVEYLLSNVAESVISTLNSDSLISKMVKKVLQVSGVRYSLGDNGYIVFGQFFGNFCIQWGVVPEGQTETDLPVNVQKTLMIAAIDVGWVDGNIYNVLWRADKSTANHIVFQVSSAAIGGYGFVAFCRLSMP